jgi:hypothetical protein
MQDEHPLAPHMPDEAAAKQLAEAVDCSVPHLRNIRDGRKSASLALAKRLSVQTGIPMDAFLKPAVAYEAIP